MQLLICQSPLVAGFSFPDQSGLISPPGGEMAVQTFTLHLSCADNHWAKGDFQINVFFQGVDHTKSSRARSAQYFSGFFLAFRHNAS